VHRLRKRFRELFRAQIAETVSNTAAVEDEVRDVVAVLSWELKSRKAKTSRFEFLFDGYERIGLSAKVNAP
jgi:hypothetical protein